MKTSVEVEGENEELGMKIRWRQVLKRGHEERDKKMNRGWNELK